MDPRICSSWGRSGTKINLKIKHPSFSGSMAGRWFPDYMPDDTALAYVGKEGLSIITGCSHAGICNIIAQAKGLPEKCGSIVFWAAFT